MPTKARINVNSLKITLPLKSEQVPRDIVPPECEPGAAKKKVYWDIVLVGSDDQAKQIFTTSFSVKNYRKCLKALAQHEAAGGVVKRSFKTASVQVKAQKSV